MIPIPLGVYREQSFHCLVLVQVDRAKVLSNTIKQKRKQKAGKWEVPLPKVSSSHTHHLT